MMPSHPFRFGVVAALARTGDEWLSKARRIESLGYAMLAMPDGLRYSLAPLPALAAAASATQSLRVGTYVIANDFRNPVLLAKEAATVDVLSGGRFELGIGAGRPGAEDDNRMLGMPFDSGGVRLARLAESLGVLKALLAGQTASAPGPHYAVANAEISPRPIQQPRPPILMAASGKQMLTLAAREADIIALGVPPHASAEAVAEKIGWIREAAGARFDRLELNLNLMAVGQQVPRYLSTQLGLTADGLAQSGAVTAVTGTPEEMATTLLRRRDQSGISYLMVSDELMDAFAPVVERLAGR
jgi:probable F420-dependent oxidoreductase